MIDFNKTRQYTLSIRLSTDGFCFAAHNPLADNEYAYQPYRIDVHKSLAANLKTAIAETEMLRHTYGTVNILLDHVPYTVVPKEYYAEQCAHDIFLQNFPRSAANIQVMANVVGEEQAVVLFGLDGQLHKLISEQYPKARLSAAIAPLINYAVEKSYACKHRYCLVHLRKRSVDLLCVDNGAPLFINTFGGDDVADIPYFLLNCWQMLGLSQTDDTLHIAGTTRNSKSLVKELSRFISNVRWVRPAEEFHSTELARIDDMTFDLQTLISCE